MLIFQYAKRHFVDWKCADGDSQQEFARNSVPLTLFGYASKHNSRRREDEGGTAVNTLHAARVQS